MATLVNYKGELLTFDAKFDEKHVSAAIIPDHPMVGGFTTDNIQVKPRTINIRAIISESPFEDAATDVPNEADYGNQRAWAAKLWLEASQAGGLFTFISLRYGVIENLALEEITTNAPRTASGEYDLSFKQIAFSRALYVDIPAEYIPPTAKPNKECQDQAVTKVIENGKAVPSNGKLNDSFYRFGVEDNVVDAAKGVIDFLS
jgi:hypothetical protein